MHHLFKGVSRSSTLLSRPSSMLAMNQLRVFTSRPGYPVGAETNLTDVADIFKVNYTVEFDQGISED
jgi:hypothetical protein